MDDPRKLFNLEGRVACVTGASSGLGRRAAVCLAAAGAKVVGVARRQDALQTLKNELGENVDFVVADVADHAALENLHKEITKSFGAPDIIVHAAGINRKV